MFKNIGWTLGNDCPCKCNHCYSMQVREKGQNLNKEIVDRVIEQICKLGAETVNFGGNEPIYTNGLDINESLLPYIINETTKRGLKVGITTMGLTAILLEKHYNEEFVKMNDIDVSIDSPIEEEHNQNRGKNVFQFAIKTLELCNQYNKPCSIVMCAMKWNFTPDRIIKLVELAHKYNANVRINMLKPTEKKHIDMMPSKKQIYEGYKCLIQNCDVLDASDPILAGFYDNNVVNGCSCGISSLRINSITCDGKIPVSPCVYMHNHKVGNLLEDDILDIINHDNFKAFKERKENYDQIEACKGCKSLDICRGGCAAASYWYHHHTENSDSMFNQDPYCIMEYDDGTEKGITYKKQKNLVHQNYLCTWIGRPNK